MWYKFSALKWETSWRVFAFRHVSWSRCFDTSPNPCLTAKLKLLYMVCVHIYLHYSYHWETGCMSIVSCNFLGMFVHLLYFQPWELQMQNVFCCCFFVCCHFLCILLLPQPSILAVLRQQTCRVPTLSHQHLLCHQFFIHRNDFYLFVFSYFWHTNAKWYDGIVGL